MQPRWRTTSEPGRRWILLTASIFFAFLVPAGVRAQEGAPDKLVDKPQDTPQDKQAQRPTGLPSPITWTFNFDAGWGTFGFGNSLFINPKDPGVEENLSDQWFEGYVKPALSAIYTLRAATAHLR